MELKAITIPIEVELSERTRILLEALGRMLPPRVVAPAPGADDTVQSSAQPATTRLQIGQHCDTMGGIYAGITRGVDGQADAQLFLLPDLPPAKLKWSDAVDWAAGLGNGANLPTRFESALLYANLQDELDQTEWHWTGTQYSDSYAWFQYFPYGNQLNILKSYERRCRAVRRLIL